jgi:hypothetical protein
MSRIALSIAMLLLAATAQGMTPARQDANGSGGSCPESQAVVAEDPAEATGSASRAPVAPAVATPAKPAAAATRRSGARWHTFLPGMFK